MSVPELTQDQAVRFLLAEGIGPITVSRLVEHFGNADAVFGSSAAGLREVDGIGEVRAGELLRAWNDHEAVGREKQQAADLGVQIVTAADAHYPQNLCDVSDAPFMLYVKGTLQEGDNLAVALVGSRRASFYGAKVAGRLAQQLVGLGMTVVSGLARGIDAAAHRAAMENQGRTIAVLGTGFANIYPEEHRQLADEVAAHGAVVSEFPMATAAQPGNFPRRNRIISGMSLGVVVVEAPKRSGALITARLAGEQGREVFAVPGKIDMPSFTGCHALIKDGAKLVEDVQDIIAELGPLSRELALPEGVVSTPKSLLLNEREKAIYDCLGSDPTQIDDIIASTGLTPAVVSSVLLILEVRKLVTQLPGKQFVRSQVFA